MTLCDFFWCFALVLVSLVSRKLLDLVVGTLRVPEWCSGWRGWVAVAMLLGSTAGLGACEKFSAAPGGTGLEVSAASAQLGRLVSATGHGFDGREGVRLVMDVNDGRLRDVPLVNTTADAEGDFKVSFVVPRTALGAQGLSALGTVSGHRETVGFTVPTPTPKIMLTLPPGLGGARVGLTGSGFVKGEAVDLQVAGQSVTTVGADGSGKFVATVLPSSGATARSGARVPLTAIGMRTGLRFGTATGSYLMTALTTPRPPSRTTSTQQPGPQPDPALPKAYLATWVGHDVSDPRLPADLALVLTGGAVGTVVGYSAYLGAIGSTGTLVLRQVTGDTVLLEERLDPPYGGVSWIAVSTSGRNLLKYASNRRRVTLTRR